MVTLEEVLDLIAERLIESQFVNPNLVQLNQKTIRDGLVQLNRTKEEILLLYQTDVRANQEDLIAVEGNSSMTLTQIVENIPDNLSISDIQIPVPTAVANGDIMQITFNYNGLDGGPLDITSLLNYAAPDGSINPQNISQFVNIGQDETIIDPNQANEFLDTTIYELLPVGKTRQDRINKLYEELNVLLPPNPPEFDLQDDDGNPSPDGRVDRTDAGDWVGAQQYYYDNSISAAQDNPAGATIDEEEAYLTRLAENAPVGSRNSGKTIEDFRNLLNPYLLDVDEEPAPPIDDRPPYINQSDGYLKFRNLNEGIIIRNTNSEYVDGLHPTDREYLITGFTITMWVRFLDKTSQGTLFNFGNPETTTGDKNGFKLETIIDDDEQRYVKLLVYNNNESRYYDSHTGFTFTSSNLNKIDTVDLSSLSGIDSRQYLKIPHDFNEWYFICATYNPFIDEIGSNFNVTLVEYWTNNYDDVNSEYVINSGFGNRSKVEMISRSDLLRARGFGV